MLDSAEQELSEDLLWADDNIGADSGDEEQPHASSEEHEEPPTSSKQKGLDITGASSASHQSSTLRASLEEELDPDAPTPSPPIDMPGSYRMGSTLMQQQLARMPQQPQQYPRLGTSAPIAIPNMSRWRPGAEKAAGRPGEAASTFIPPHQLSRQEDFTFSFTGASPSAALKRERLRARNAILRSTGFLEPQAGAGIPAAAASGHSLSDSGLARTPVQSSLTAALTTIGES